MYKDILKWLVKEGFNSQSVVSIGKFTYPSKSLIINIHDFLVQYFWDKDSNVKIFEGVRSDANLDFCLFHIKYVIFNKSGVQ